METLIFDSFDLKKEEHTSEGVSLQLVTTQERKEKKNNEQRRKRIPLKIDHGGHSEHNPPQKVQHTQSKLVQILVEETMLYP